MFLFLHQNTNMKTMEAISPAETIRKLLAEKRIRQRALAKMLKEREFPLSESQLSNKLNGYSAKPFTPQEITVIMEILSELPANKY